MNFVKVTCYSPNGLDNGNLRYVGEQLVNLTEILSIDYHAPSNMYRLIPTKNNQSALFVMRGEAEKIFAKIGVSL